MTKSRKNLKKWAKGLQGKQHENKTACATACADFFQASFNVRYLHKVSDIVKSIRKQGYFVRSRFSFIKKGSSVGNVRKQLQKLGTGYYLIRVDYHCLLMNQEGSTIVDTDPRKRDRRKITHIYKIYK